MVLRVENGVKQFDRQLLDYLVKGKNVEALAMLKNIDPSNLFDNSRKSLLHWTIRNSKIKYGNASMIQYFIEKGCNVNTPDKDGNTPLLMAVEDDQMHVVKALINANANIFISNICGISPIKHVFTRWGLSDRDVVKLFLNQLKSQCGNDKQMLVNKLIVFKCPVYVAVLLKDAEITRMMLDRGRSIKAQCHVTGVTALHEAVRQSDLAHVKLLVDRGADIKALGRYQQTPLHYYDTDNDTDENLELLKFFLARGTALCVVKGSITPMEKLFFYGTKKTIRTLLQFHGFVLRAKDFWGNTAMHLVCKNDRPDIIRYFCGMDFDINAVNNNKNTALMMAVKNGNVSTVERLLELGADPNVQNNRGKTTILYSLGLYPKDHGIFRDIVDLLTMYGVDTQHHSSRGQDKLPFLNKFGGKGDLEFMGSVIARLAEMELRDKSTINPSTQVFIKNNMLYQQYFELCKESLEEMKSITVFESLTLFKLLNGISKKKLAGYARNEEFVAAYNRIVTEELDSLPRYYSFVVKKRVTAAITMANLKEQAASVICKIIELNEGHIIAYKIIDYLDIEDLKDLIKAI